MREEGGGGVLVVVEDGELEGRGGRHGGGVGGRVDGGVRGCTAGDGEEPGFHEGGRVEEVRESGRCTYCDYSLWRTVPFFTDVDLERKRGPEAGCHG